MSQAPATAERLRPLISHLEQGLLERETAARLVLLAALAGEHCLLIGPPGTAKSLLARRLHHCFSGARYFERLLTRFSTPEELFGPLSLQALEADRYERLVDGFLPTAGVAFLDEVFKANSAILNALLTLLNEREFDNGSGRQRVPLISVVAASNEVPVDEALHAFHDRFLVRVPVAPVSDAHFEALLRLPPAEPAAPRQALTPVDRESFRRAAQQVRLEDDALAACASLRRWLATRVQGLSDRRWRQWIDLMRTAAATEGRPTVDVLDLWLAPYVASATPDQVSALAEWFQAECLGAVPQLFPWFERAVQAFDRQLEIETTAPVAEGDDTAGKLALARSLARGDDAAEPPGMMRIVAQALEEQQRRRYSRVHIAARTGQVEALLEQAMVRLDHAKALRDGLAQRLAPRLWLPAGLKRQWLAAHDQTLQTLGVLVQRLMQLRAGFAALPEETGSAPPQGQPAAEPPQPVTWAADAP